MPRYSSGGVPVGKKSTQQELPALPGDRAAVFVALCTLLGLGIRVAMAARSGLWCDEAQFLWIVRIPSMSGMIDFLWHHESHPPLYYLLMRAWQGIFGESEAAALALPIILGVFLIPISYYVGRRVFSSSIGLIAAALIATSPLMVRHSALVRPYSLLPLLCLLSVFSLWRCLMRGGVGSWALHAGVNIAMLLTHNWAWVVLGAEWVTAVGWFLLRPTEKDTPPIGSWMLCQVAVLVAYSPWLPIFIHQAGHAGFDAQPVNASLVLLYSVETALSLPIHVALPVSCVLILVAAWMVFHGKRMGQVESTGDRLGILLFVAVPVLAFVIATILSARKFLLFPRCLTTIVPCVLLAAAYAIASMTSIPRITTVAVSIIYVAFALEHAGEPKSNAREVASFVAARARPTDLIVVTPVWLASPFNYYFAPNNPQSNYPHEERRDAIDYDDLRGRLLDPQSMAKARARLAQARREGRRVWLVTAQGLRVDNAPQSDWIPAPSNWPTYIHVGHVRAVQLRRELEQLYGSPEQSESQANGQGELETLVVSLYSPGEPSRGIEGKRNRSEAGNQTTAIGDLGK